MTIITQKRAEYVSSSSRLDAKTHCESRNANSQGSRTGKFCQDGGHCAFLYHHFMQRILIAKEFSQLNVTSNSYRSRADRAGDRNRSIQICRSSGYGSASAVPTTKDCEVRISLGVEQLARRFIPKSTEHQGPGTVLSPQSSSCGRPRGEQSQVRYKAAPKPKLVSIGLSQRNWKIILANAKQTRKCEF